MDPLLQEITMLPGVLGCFVYNTEQQIVCSKMPPIFRENSMKSIGSLLSRTVQIGSMAMLSLKGIEMKYNESLLIIKPLPKEALLILVCEPSANKSLISMTTGILAEDIAKALANSAKIQKIAPQAKKAQQTQKHQKQVKQEKEAAIDAKLAPILEQVKDALAMAIGPIAGPVMKDNIEIWAKQKSPSLSNLPALTILLCQEINDEKLEKEFMATIKTITN